MKIYTRGGDDGSTGLFGGGRVLKNDSRIECYGTVDELNAVLGLAETASDDALRAKLRVIQNELFVVGSHLATPSEKRLAALPKLEDASIARLEQEIDAAEAVLTPLQNFILPGGSETAARLHVARAVCRRAERLLVGLPQGEVSEALILKYLNRLSDWLFVYARFANQRAGISDVLWTTR